MDERANGWKEDGRTVGRTDVTDGWWDRWME